MFADYERLVLEYYQWKKSQNELSSQLLHPTPARIKRECVRLCGAKLQKKDEKVIMDFCEVWDNTKTYVQNIEKCEVDKFRPLLKYLKRDIESTDPKNIHLLAWLIDFPDRPFEFGKKYGSVIEIQAGVKEPEPSDIAVDDVSNIHEYAPVIATEKMKNADTEDEEGKGSSGTKEKSDFECTEDVVQGGQSHIDQTRKKRGLRNVAMVGLLLAVTGTVGLWWRNATPQINGGCMYWAKDHFQPIPCNMSIPNTLVVALDTSRVKNFKKITRPDTITNRAKGSVWYSKINNEIEFFTADGGHPVVIGRRLKPVSDYIINKYVHPAMSLKQ